MINGAHAIIYSTDADADRAFFRDVLKLPSVDAGGGWLILRTPAASPCTRRTITSITSVLMLHDTRRSVRHKNRLIACGASSKWWPSIQ